MITSFAEMEREVLSRPSRKVIALAGADNEDALKAVIHAHDAGIADAVLVGNGERIRALLDALGADPKDYGLVEAADEAPCARTACQLVKEGKADIPMKGRMQTATFMHAILDREAYGFVPSGSILSQSTVVEHGSRLLQLTDCAVNIAPDFKAKCKIVKNAASLARRFGIEKPKVAAVAPVEVVNPAIPATVDAAMLAKASDRGQLGDCQLDGPFGFDNAMSREAARIKGITSEVAGHPDIVLVPDLGCGNVLTKALVHFVDGIKSCGVLLGCTVPVVMTSRTDTPENKYYAILTSIL